MPAQLVVTEGPAKGKSIPLTPGKTITVGRSAAKSMIALPEDEHLSGQHFSAGLRNGRLYLCNLSKTNPTEIDGKQIQSAVLNPGGTFRAGANIFAMSTPQNPHGAALMIGGWGFKNVPEAWDLHEGVGFKHRETEPFRASLLVAEEPLPKDHDLVKYVALQIKLGKEHLKEVSFSGPRPASVVGAEETLALAIRALAEKGRAQQYQIYALHNGIVGVVTATALESQGQILRDMMSQVLPGLSFHQG